MFASAESSSPLKPGIHRQEQLRQWRAPGDLWRPAKPTCGDCIQPVDVWASPDCRHNSNAKGGKPRDRKIRWLAWVIIRWAFQTRPGLIFLENLEEFADWGPLDGEGRPIKAQKGRTLQAFVNVLGNGIPEDHPDLPEILAD